MGLRFERVVEIVRNEGKPIDINKIARRLNVHWFTVYKAIFDQILEILQKNYPEVLEKLPIVPVKTSKSCLIFPKNYGVLKKAKGDEKRRINELENSKR